MGRGWTLAGFAKGLLVVLAVAVAGTVLRGVAAGGAAGPPGGRLPVAPVSERTTFSRAALQSRRVPSGASLIAAARHRRIRVYRRPHSRHVRRLNARRIGRTTVPLHFLVVGKRRGWVRVQLPTRPNRSTGWVRRSAVRVGFTTLKIVVDRRRHRLELRRGGRVVLRSKIALGAALSPTPRGRYFLSDVVRPTNPKGFYGPYSLGTSAHSNVLTSYAGGDGQIAIHGTNEPWSIGRSVSHGCIRVPNRVVRRLAARVPLGAPIVIR